MTILTKTTFGLTENSLTTKIVKNKELAEELRKMTEKTIK
jgi:hypothetical protein